MTVRQRSRITARDGTVLAGFVHEPAVPASATVVIRTPYDAGAHSSAAAWWTRHGYRVLVQDVRGRYRSGGRWHPYTNEGRDGADTLRAVVEHYHGPVVAVGASYAAHCALELSRGTATDPTRVAGVVAMVPALGRYETAHHTDGTPRLRERFGWWHQHGFGRFAREPLPEPQLRHLTELAQRTGPLTAALAAGWSASRLVLWRQLWAARPLDLVARYAPCTAPLLVVGGAHDFFAADALRLSHSWPSGHAYHVSGPWGHNMMAGITDPQLRAALARHGGPGRAVLAWMSAHVTGDRHDGWPAAGASVLDPDLGWRHLDHLCTPTTSGANK